MGWQTSSLATLFLGFFLAQALWPWLRPGLPALLALRLSSVALLTGVLLLVGQLFNSTPHVLLAMASMLPLLAMAELCRYLGQPRGQAARWWTSALATLVLAILIITFLDESLAYLLAALLVLCTPLGLWRWLRQQTFREPQHYPLWLAGLTLLSCGLLILLLKSQWFASQQRLDVFAMLLISGGVTLCLWLPQALPTDSPASHVDSGNQNDARHAQQQLFISLSHDMRTPLSGILGMAELLLETALSPTQREYAQTIQSSGNALLHVLNDRLDVSAQSPQEISILEEIFDLNELMNYCLDLFKTQAEDKQVELIGYLDTALPRQVLGDAVRLRQILSRLMHNALRFTDQGDIVVSIKSAVWQNELAVQFCVQDTGYGMDENQRWQVLNSGTPQSGDSGSSWHIGPPLPACQRLILAMGGEMGIDSHAGLGSNVWFTLPLKVPHGLLSESTTEFIASFSGKRLLVVDDNRTVSRVLAEQASQWGMRVSTAESGTEALAVARNAANLGQPFDVIIMDYQMPGMSGLQLGARLKEDTLITNDVILIMLTGLRQNNIQTLVRNAGIHRVLSKPVTSKQLRQVISQELRRLQGLQQQEAPTADVAAHLGRLHVLIAEDNQLSQKVIRGMMQKLGVQNTIVSNGREAVQAVTREHYDIVLMDCDMPFVDGYTATQEIRTWERQQQRRAIPILALTAHILEEQKQKAVAAGMNEHLSKPIELCDLQNALLRWSQG